jgi:predicted PolB exonuclease-like 3'-5' exonuclease
LWLGPDHVVRKLGVLAEAKPEAEMLVDLTRFLDKHRPVLVTYNGRGFDLPVLASRCLGHGVPFSYYYQERDVRYRFSPAGHLDLMDFLSDFGAAKRARLDVMARLCGMPGKVGVAGKDVGPLIHAGRLSEVCDYCLCDVVQTAAIFLRLQLLRGELERQDYLTAMRSLLSTARAEPRVGVVVDAWDEPRLLLGE